MQPLSDERQLISRAQHGDKNAISALYLGYVKVIFRYISYRVETDSVAEDLTAEVFLLMVQELPRYQDTQAPLGAWLFRIASNQVSDHYRHKRRTTTEALDDDHASDDTDPFGKLAAEEERIQLRRALAALPEEHQTLLILRFIQQLPHADVAGIMGRSEAAIRTMQHRALKALAKELGAPHKARSYLRGEEA
jgi:RNA polymerase sigma-70 factor (ECF subfamily)